MRMYVRMYGFAREQVNEQDESNGMGAHWMLERKRKIYAKIRISKANMLEWMFMQMIIAWVRVFVFGSVRVRVCVCVYVCEWVSQGFMLCEILFRWFFGVKSLNIAYHSISIYLMNVWVCVCVLVLSCVCVLSSCFIAIFSSPRKMIENETDAVSCIIVTKTCSTPKYQNQRLLHVHIAEICLWALDTVWLVLFVAFASMLRQLWLPALDSYQSSFY